MLIVVGLLAGSTCFAQTPEIAPPQTAEQATANAQPEAAKPAPSPVITIPAGTKVPVTLTSPVISKKTHKGDSVRVVTAFPVTVGTQMAIPAGTYLEGVIDKVQKPDRSGQGHLEMHFTRMVYSSGYEVALTDATVAAHAHEVEKSAPASEASPKWGMRGEDFFGDPQQQPPMLPPNPQQPQQPSIGKAVGIGLGVTAVVAVVGIVLARRGHGAGYETVFDAGTQFDLIFRTDIAVDAAKVAVQGN
jgi:type IV secretion system protein VirB10